MKITIIGGGHLGHVCAGYLGSQEGVELRILTRRPNDWSNQLIVTDPEGRTFSANLKIVTAEASEALEDTDIALLCLPGYSIKETLERIAPSLSPKTAVGSVVSSTGFFFQAFDTLPSSQPLFGFQRVPFISRTLEYGHSARLLGYKPSLAVAIEQTNDKETLRSKLQNLFRCPVKLMESYYEVSLSNSNPLLHTSRLYTLWHDYKDGIVYDSIPQFYADWDVETSRLYIQMDNELQQLLTHLGVRAGAVPDVLTYYESTDAQSLTRKISTIPAFKGLKAPMLPSVQGFVPDFTSRYFTEDFTFGLSFIHTLAHQHNIPSPSIDKVFEWGKKLL